MKKYTKLEVKQLLREIILSYSRGEFEQTAAELESEGYITKTPQLLPKDNIIEMSELSHGYPNLTDQDLQNLFMGIIRLVRRQERIKQQPQSLRQ